MLTTSQQERLKRNAGCPIRFDDLTRALYATDASVYQITPDAVAFPKGADETVALVRAAAEHDVPVVPRGAGTGLAGGAVGEGMVVDFSRYNRAIGEFNPDARTVNVEPGVVLDQLNTFLAPHGFRFGPDVATSSRATLGGMIANNSSGAHTPVWGTTSAHVRSLDLVLADGTRATIGRDAPSLDEFAAEIRRLIEELRPLIDERMPAGLLKRWPGYGLDRWLRDRPDLTRILTGSEGTLALIVGAELDVVPLPARKGLGAICFASVAEAMQATVELLDLKPAAIEHIDRLLFDQTRGQLAFERARALLELDHKPCEAILLVEFFDEVDDPLHALQHRDIGLRRATFTAESDMNDIWELRKAGLTLLTSRPGPAKPAPGIEDAAVLPAKLPEYVAGLRHAMDGLGLDGSFYGHAASGLLHVRPVVNLHRAGDIERYRKLAIETSALVKQFKGSIAAEHGVGIARSEFLAEHLGPELAGAFRHIKELFDPKNLLNPGKIVADGRYRIDTNLRQGEASEIELPFEPRLAFAFRDRSFINNLEQCNGNGACRKDPAVMCPTYRATGDEAYSTRGYANTIRAVLEERVDSAANPLDSPALDHVLHHCLACKACAKECPANVNMPLLKAELLYARHQLSGIPIATRLLSSVDRLGRLGTVMPRMANATLGLKPMLQFAEFAFGIAAERPLPRYAAQRFDKVFYSRKRQSSGDRGVVYLWDDCFVRYHEPHVGHAAVRVLEAAGYDVRLIEDRVCCGRPAFSLGRLDVAAELGTANLNNLPVEGPPIVFLEPSCYSMFAQDYRELSLDGAETAPDRAWIFEEFIENLLDSDSGALPLRQQPQIAVHGHCHAKAVSNAGIGAHLAETVFPDSQVLRTGCCGMAGAYGAMRRTYDLSLKIAQPLIDQVRALPPGARVVASGTSCRHQIEHLTSQTPWHMAEALAAALDGIEHAETA